MLNLYMVDAGLIHVCYSYIPVRMKVISLLLHESEAEPRTSVITMISSECTGYNYLCPSVREYMTM